AYVLFINILIITAAFGLNYYFVIGSNGTQTYQFGYDTTQQDGAPRLMREEGRLSDGTVIGRYGYTDPFGVFRVVKYAAGPNGYYAFEDVGGASSSEPLFFKATARQKEALAEQAKSLIHQIATKFNPPLYHPEAHLTESDKPVTKLDSDFQKLVFNAQNSAKHSHQSNSSELIKHGENENTKSSNLNEEKTKEIDLDELEEKSKKINREEDILKELESERLTVKPSVHSTPHVLNKSESIHRHSWIIHPIVPSLSDTQSFLNLNNFDPKYDKPKKAIEEETLAVNNASKNENTSSLINGPILNRTLSRTEEIQLEKKTVLVAETRDERIALPVSEESRRKFVLPKSLIEEQKDLSSIESQKSSRNIEENHEINEDDNIDLSSFGTRLTREKRIQNLKSIFSSLIKQNATNSKRMQPNAETIIEDLKNSKYLKNETETIPRKVERKGFILTTNERNNYVKAKDGSTSSLLVAPTIKSILKLTTSTNFDFDETKFPETRLRDSEEISSGITAEFITSNPTQKPSEQTTTNKEFDRYETTTVTNVPLVNEEQTFTTLPPESSTLATEFIETTTEFSPMPVFEESFSTVKPETMTTDSFPSTKSELTTKSFQIKKWSRINENPISSDLDFYYDKAGIESPESENNMRRRVVKVWFRKKEIFSPRLREFEQKPQRKAKIFQIGEKQINKQKNSMRSFETSSPTKENLAKEKLKSESERKSKEESGKNKTQVTSFETHHNNLKHGTLYVPPLGLLSLFDSSRRELQSLRSEKFSKQTNANFYIPPIPVIRNRFANPFESVSK
ncbi:cell wall protein IFF6-like protein, partial [Dinothrombium tinctorium]